MYDDLGPRQGRLDPFRQESCGQIERNLDTIIKRKFSGELKLAESRLSALPQNLMRIIPTKGEKR